MYPNCLSNLDSTSSSAVLKRCLGGSVLLALASSDLASDGREDQLDVGRRRLVLVDTAVSTVHAAAHLGSLVDLDVRDLEAVGADVLSLSVGLSVPQESKDVLANLDGPAADVSTVLLALRVARNTIAVAAEGNDVLLLDHVVEVGPGLLKGKTADRSKSLAGVLERHTEVVNLGAN